MSADNLLSFYDSSSQILPTLLLAAFVGNSVFPPDDDREVDTQQPLPPTMTLGVLACSVAGEAAALFGLATGITSLTLTVLVVLGLLVSGNAVLVPVVLAQLRVRRIRHEQRTALDRALELYLRAQGIVESPPPISPVVLVAPAVMGVILAAVGGNPLYLSFAAVSTFLHLGNWLSARKRYRRMLKAQYAEYLRSGRLPGPDVSQAPEPSPHGSDGDEAIHPPPLPVVSMVAPILLAGSMVAATGRLEFLIVVLCLPLLALVVHLHRQRGRSADGRSGSESLLNQ